MTKKTTYTYLFGVNVGMFVSDVLITRSIPMAAFNAVLAAACFAGVAASQNEEA